MRILAGVGSSQNPNPKEAIQEACTQASKELNNNAPSFIMLLASPTTYDQQELLNHLKTLNPSASIIGCSTSGEITSVAGSLDHSIALISIYSDTVKFIPGFGTQIKENSRLAGKSLAESVMKNNNGEKPRAMLMLPDGLSGNGADIVRGVLDVFGQDFMVAGGSAGDDFQFKQTYEYYDNKVMTNSVVGIGISGEFSYGIGVRHGWIPIGTPRTVTKSIGNVLYELDHKPAIQIYEDHFGKGRYKIDKNQPFAKLAITYPLGIPSPNKDGYLIRDPLAITEDGAITVAAEIPEGSEAHIMIGSREEAIDAAEDAAKKALAQVEGKQIKAIFLFNCIARKKLLMTKKQEEIDRIRSVFGQDIPLIGFYTYGEQAPLGGEIATCSFHNETDVVFVLAE